MAKRSMVVSILLALIFLISIAAHGQSSVRISVIAPQQHEQISGASFVLQVETTSPKSQARVYVTAIFTYPGGAIERFSMVDDGLSEGDTPGDGIFVARIERLRVPGDYSVRAKAWSGGVEAWSAPITFTFIPTEPLALPQATQKNQWLFPSMLALLIVTVILLAALLFRQRRSPVSTALPVPEIDSVIKEIRRLRTEMGVIAESVQDNSTTLTSHLSAIESQKELGVENDEVYTLRLELEATRNAIEAWKETAIDYFETLQRGIEEYGEGDPRGKALLRDASLFSRFCAARGLERITAKPGDPLVDGLFQVVGEVATADAPAETILCCTEWGYRSGTTVYKRATVVLAKALTDKGVTTDSLHP